MTHRAARPRTAIRLPALALVALATLLLAGEARADRRIFGYTYPYMTLPRGGFEIEHYLDARFREMDDPSTPAVEDDYQVDWEHQLEAEYGITDNWDFGFYNVFRQKPFQGLSYRGFKVRSRYRFGNPGDWFVDPAVYLEVSYKFDEVELEQRLILSRMLGNFELALNLKLEQEIKVKDGNKLEIEFQPMFAVGYHLNEHWAFGLEYQGELKVEEGEVEHFGHYVGPTISIAGNHFWWTVAFQYQVSMDPDLPEFQVRSLFAVVF